MVKIHLTNGNTLTLDLVASEEFMSKTSQLTTLAIVNFKNKYLVPMSSVVYIENIEDEVKP